jgi:hypothetical protein
MHHGKKRFAMIAALALWFPAVFTGAVPTTAESPAPPQELAPSKHADGAAQPDRIPLQIGHHAANTKFRYPFLGKVRACVRSRLLRLRNSSGAFVELPVKVYYAENGNFIRLEYVKPGAGDFQATVGQIEAMSRQYSEEVTGLPKEPMGVNLEKMLQDLHRELRLENATRFNVTYVLYKTPEKAPEPHILLYVFGLPNPALGWLGNEERFRRIRVVMDRDGDFKWQDNLL